MFQLGGHSQALSTDLGTSGDVCLCWDIPGMWILSVSIKKNAWEPGVAPL